jgi:hypothetical protein
MHRVEIRIQGQIAKHWSTWFDDLDVVYTEGGETLLKGTVPDQAALYGLIAKLRDLGLSLISVDSVDLDQGPGG